MWAVKMVASMVELWVVMWVNYSAEQLVVSRVVNSVDSLAVVTVEMSVVEWVASLGPTSAVQLVVWKVEQLENKTVGWMVGMKVDY